MSGAVLVLCLAGGAAAGCGSAALLNRVPASWLCDYGEQPTPALLGTRIRFVSGGTVLAVLFAACFTLFAVQYGISPRLFTAVLAALPLVWAAWADLRYRIIPDQFAGLLLAAALLYRLSFGSAWELLRALAGAAAGAGLILLMEALGRLLYHREAMGGGDVKLMAAAGALAGFPLVFILFLLTVLLAFVYIVYAAVRHRLNDELYLPFAPYIDLAALLLLAFSKQISAFLHWYRSLLNL